MQEFYQTLTPPLQWVGSGAETISHLLGLSLVSLPACVKQAHLYGIAHSAMLTAAVTANVDLSKPPGIY